MNLYSKLVPAASEIVDDQVGLASVYFAAESAGAEEVDQLPNSEIEPAILMVWPTTVLTFSLKVTATLATDVEQDPVALVAADVATFVDNVVDGLALDAGALGIDPEPEIEISAQLR